MTTRSSDGPHVVMPITSEDARDALQAIGAVAPDVARTSREAVVETLRWIESGSDDRVATGATLSLGLAMGLVVGGAPRLLIAVALLPVLAFGMVVLDRRRRARPSG